MTTKQKPTEVDSSYDSEPDDCVANSHPSCSRTTSDTLAAEFAEHVTLTSYGDSARLDFARKLGYTEEQVKIALGKLGPEPSQNELLGELIGLDNGAGGGGGGEEELLGDDVCGELLRDIVVDGSNVAMSHGNNTTFSPLGLQLAFDYFKSRNHPKITILLPSHRSDPQNETLTTLAPHITYTPSRLTPSNKLITPYDDRYILKLALETDAVIVSNDNYRDLAMENQEYKKLIEERLLMYSFVNGKFLPPEDPLGRNGPSLEQFLSKESSKGSRPCPYGKKCTYGGKCKYYHKFLKESVSESLRRNAVKTQSVPLDYKQKVCLNRTKSDYAAITTPNTHKKLARQLSINPAGDPRISSSFLPAFPLDSKASKIWMDEGDERTKLFYQISQIFPEFQVKHVMDLYPDCKDAGFICTQIVKIFSS